MNHKKNGPNKGAGRRLAARLKELGQRPPPQDLVDKLNHKDEKKKVALPADPIKELDI